MSYSRSFKTMTVIAVMAILAVTMVIPAATYASDTGKRNTALVLTGLAAYLLADGKTGAGLVSAAGAAVAWDKYSQSRDDRCGRWDRDHGRSASFIRSSDHNRDNNRGRDVRRDPKPIKNHNDRRDGGRNSGRKR